MSTGMQKRTDDSNLMAETSASAMNHENDLPLFFDSHFGGGGFVANLIDDLRETRIEHKM